MTFLGTVFLAVFSGCAPQPADEPVEPEVLEVVDLLVYDEPTTYEIESWDRVIMSTSPRGPVAISQSLEGRLRMTQLWPEGEIFEVPFDPVGIGKLKAYPGAGTPSVLLLGKQEGPHSFWRVQDDGLIAETSPLPDDWGLEGAVDHDTVYMSLGGDLVAVEVDGGITPVLRLTDHLVRWVSTGHGLLVVSSYGDVLEVHDLATGERWQLLGGAHVLMVALDERTLLSRDIATEEMVVMELRHDGFVEVLQRSPWPRRNGVRLVPWALADGTVLVHVDVEAGEVMVQPVALQ